MKIAVISDIHENLHNLILFFEQIKKQDVTRLVFLGDFMNNGVAKFLAASEVPVTAIWGNNDGEKVAITKTSLDEKSNLTIGFDTFDILEYGNRKIFITHYPMLAKPMARSGDFDAVFYGHNHKKNIEQIGNCLVLNPGEISAHKTGEASYAIYDTEANSAELFVVEDSISLKTDKVKEHIKEAGFEYSKSKGHQY